MKPNEVDNAATETPNLQPQSDAQDVDNANNDSNINENDKTDAALTPQDAINQQDNINNSEAVNEPAQQTDQTKQSDEAKQASEAKDAEDEYVKMVKELQEVVKDAKRSIVPPSMDKDTISLDNVHRSPIDADYPAFVPVKCLESIGFS